MFLMDFLDLPNELVSGFKAINLVLAIVLVLIVVIGMRFMRGREAYQCSGKYALTGLLYLSLGGLVAATANFIEGEQEVLALIATGLRVASLVYLITHVVFNLRGDRLHTHREE